MKRKLIIVAIILCVIMAGYYLLTNSAQKRQVSDQEMVQALHQELDKPANWPMAVKLTPPQNYVVFSEKPLEHGLKVLLDSGLATTKDTRIVLAEKARPEAILAADPEMRQLLEQKARALPAQESTTVATTTTTPLAAPVVAEEQPTDSKSWSIPPLAWQIALGLLSATLVGLATFPLAKFLKRKYIERKENQALPVVVLTGEALAKQQHRQKITKGVLIVAAIATLISPIDLIPDFIPIIGFVDDLGAGLFLLKQILEYLQRMQQKYGNKVKVTDSPQLPKQSPFQAMISTVQHDPPTGEEDAKISTDPPTP